MISLGKLYLEQSTSTLFKKSKEYFGITRDPSESGYIMPDGNMLDFSGKNEGGTPGTRAWDHRNISLGYHEAGIDLPETGEMGSGGRYMFDFMKRGAIRMGFYNHDTLTLDLIKKPTEQQLRTIGDLCRQASVAILDVKISGKKGSGEIERPTLSKIKAFIDNPTVPTEY